MITLRKVTSEQDIQATASLAHAIWNQHFPPIIGQAQVDYMVEKFQSAPAITQQVFEGYEYYLIKQQDLPVGYIALLPDPQTQQIQLSKFYITESMRGQGIGKAALRQIMTMASAKAYKTLWLTVNKYNASAIAAYERMEFVTTDSLELDIGNGFIMDDFRMEIDIPK